MPRRNTRLSTLSIGQGEEREEEEEEDDEEGAIGGGVDGDDGDDDEGGVGASRRGEGMNRRRGVGVSVGGIREDGRGRRTAAPGMNGANGADGDGDGNVDDDGGDDDEYGHADRAFLQAFLARSVMTGDEARKVLGRIWRVRRGGGGEC